MRWCRIRFVLLGLLLCVVHVVSGTCGQRFTDPASSALLSDVVIEGKVRKTADPGSDQVYNITVAIRKSVLKGANLINHGTAAKKITIGRFKNGGRDLTNCVGNVQEGRTYFFFLRDIVHPKGLHFEIMAMPVKKSKSVATELRKILCDSCAQTPTISKLTGPDSLPAGSKATLTCAAESRPNPEFSWYKDGVLLHASRKGRVRIRSRKRQSTLQIKRATQTDGGIYECVAVNAVGQARKDFAVKVLPLSNRGHTQPCLKQTYCLNGGTCMFIKEVIDEYCQCPISYEGLRCQVMTGPVLAPVEQARLLYERTLIIIGIVIAVLVFIIISIASYVLAKNRRKRFDDRRKRRQAQREEQSQPPVLVDRSSSKTRADKESVSRNENLPSDLLPKHRLFILQDSSSPSSQKTSQRNSNELPQQQLSDMKVDPNGHQNGCRQRLAAFSVYENVTDSKPLTFNNDGDFLTNKSTAATVHPESIEMSVLQETIAENNIKETGKKTCLSTSIDSGHNDFVHHSASLQPQSSEPLSSTSEPHHKYYKITEASPLLANPKSTPSEPLVPSGTSSLSSSQPMLSHQPCQNDASSRDENKTIKQPLLQNHNKHAPTHNCDQSIRPHESKSDKDLSRYALLGSNRQMYPNSNGSATHSPENNHLLKLSHSNTFPKCKVNGLALDMYSESDEEDEEIEVPYEKQLHISEEDMVLSQEALKNSSFLIATTPTRQTAHEDLVIGLLPNSVIPRPGMRKYQSEEGPAYSKFSGKNAAFLQLNVRCRSLEDPLGAGEDNRDPMKLNSTMAGSPDVETYDSMVHQPAHLHNSSYSYDPNDDSRPWDGDINKTDFTNLAKEERDKINRLRDVLPDQQPIPI